MSTTTHSVDAIVQEITIQAPAARVFEALVDPAQRMKWWGQKGRFETTNAESDLRPGGRWLMSGMGMIGRPFKVEGVYRIIERPRVLAFTWLPSWDEEATETLVRFDLDEQNGVTRVRLTRVNGYRESHTREGDMAAASPEHVVRAAEVGQSISKSAGRCRDATQTCATR
jgi:uncharacterized protein YndB with AHSA1/START domain